VAPFLDEGHRDQIEQAGQEQNQSQPFKEVCKEACHFFSSLSVFEDSLQQAAGNAFAVAVRNRSLAFYFTIASFEAAVNGKKPVFEGRRSRLCLYIRRRKRHPAMIRFTTPMKAMGQHCSMSAGKGRPSRETPRRITMK